jgi:hypothetical protein
MEGLFPNHMSFKGVNLKAKKGYVGDFSIPSLQNLEKHLLT